MNEQSYDVGNISHENVNDCVATIVAAIWNFELNLNSLWVAVKSSFADYRDGDTEMLIVGSK